MTKFVGNENLIKLLGIESLPAENKVKLLEQVGELVEKRLILRVMEVLDEQKREAFISLLENNEQDQTIKFINSNIPEFASLLQEEVLNVKQELAELERE